VPIALILIYIMLFFALKKHRDALLIFTAIPFSAIGGIFLLWLRDMPFSISAGVGFIALFGIAVLNGIILVEYFKDILKTHDKLSLQHIIDATQDRLRAVLLTASSTALGFLPMAISTGAGAEVQRPLATVVIGGLVTSTLLTLIVLPVLYAMNNKTPKLKLNSPLSILVILLLGTSISSYAQENEFEALKQKMLDNNHKLKSAQLLSESTKAAEGQAFTFNKTQIYQNYDQSEADPIASQPLYQWGIVQQFDFPTVYANKLKLNKVKTELAETQLSIAELKQIKSLQINYQNFLQAKEKLAVYDSIYKVYKAFSRMAKRKFEEGESNYLEKITAESKASQIEIDRDQLQQDLANSKLAIQALLQDEEPLNLKGRELKKLQLKSVLKQNENLSISALTIDQKMAEQATSQVGLNIPLLFFGDRSKIKSARLKARAKEAELTDAKIALIKGQEQLIELLKVQSNTLTNYENHQLKMATEILNTAKLSYKAGEIDFFRYVQSIEQAQRIKLDYLSKLRDYNQTIIQLNYFLLN